VIQLTGISWGDSNRAPGAAGGGPGKASFHDLILFKKADRTSPEFMLAAEDGRYFKQARLTLEKISVSGSLLRTISIDLESILVNSYKASGNSPVSPTDASEEIGLKFVHMKIREASVGGP
jgi:type VI protein secretion system component Hcp